MRATISRRLGSALLVGTLAFGAAACNNDPEDEVDQTEQELEERADELEQEADELEQEVRDN